MAPMSHTRPSGVPPRRVPANTPRVAAALALTLMGAAAEARAQPTTTILTHGFTTGAKGIWVETMAQAIIARAGGGSVYRYTGATGALEPVAVDGADGTTDTVVLIFNWVPESAGVSNGPNLFYTQGAGDALAGLLMAPAWTDTAGPGDLLTDRAVHFIGHSRGPCVISSAVRRLGAAGIAVDHVTNLDPHPVNGTLDAPYNFNWGDEVPVRWSNVTFADNYWRADGGGFINGLDFDGIPLPDAVNTQLSESALDCCAYTFAHLDVHLWYHGTIDHADTVCDGEQCINLSARSLWFPGGWTTTGYHFAVAGGGRDRRSDMPGPGTDPGDVPVLFNGGFASGSWAGWSYHGGGGSGAIVSVPGGHALRLTATGTSFAHNFFFLPASTTLLRMHLSVPQTASDGMLRIDLEPFGEPAVTIARLSLAGLPVDLFTPVHAVVPPDLRDRRVRLRYVYEPGAGAGPILIDDIAFDGHRTGDLNHDGAVNTPDLLALLASWGDCPDACPPYCAADLNFDCAVNAQDLLLLLANWD